MDFTTSYAAIIKQEKQSDGSLLVYGKATSDALDIDEQICDDAWLSTAMPQWFKSGGNIREQHSSIAAGVAKEYEAKADGHYIQALVVDPVSVKKVEAGVLRGFSIGIKSPRVVRDTKAANGRIIDGQIVEISLVDRPANPSCQLVLTKSVDGETTLNLSQEFTEIKEKSMTEETVVETAVGTVTETTTETVAEPVVEPVVEEVAEEVKEVVADSSKCLECGCGQVGQAHGLSQIVTANGTVSNVSLATMVTPDQLAGSEKSPSILNDADISAIIEKAVKTATELVRSEITLVSDTAIKAAEAKVVELESELVLTKSVVLTNGPSRAIKGNAPDKENKLLAKAADYRYKANSTTDPVLAKGYKALEKEYLVKAGKLDADD
jgi:hypothetical protein